MFSAIGGFWFSFYIKKVREPFFGLTPLQQYIVEYYDDKDKEAKEAKEAKEVKEVKEVKEDKADNKDNPLLTYFYFLTYEKEILDRKGEAEGKAGYNKKLTYEASRTAVMEERTIENTTHKMLVHMLSLVFIVTLMISASAVSTGKLMGMWGESFGPYAYLMQGFFFATAAAAQWMIYRKTVPKVLKKFLSDSEGWHFNKLRILKITDNRLECKDGTPLNYSRLGLVFFMFCSALLAASLGMIVLDTSFGTVEEGNVFLSMQAISAVASTVFFGVDNLGWLLCIASIACNFALFVNASIEFLFERANKKEALNEETAEKGWTWTKAGAVAALVSLVVLNFFGLTATVMAQSQSTLNVAAGDDAVSADSLFSKIFMPSFTFIAGICGRGLFNIDAMKNLRLLLSEMWTYRADIWNESKKDVKDHAGLYMLGTACAVVVGGVFGLSFVGKTDSVALNVFTNSNSILPFVITLGAAIVTFSLFKMGCNYRESNKLPAEVGNNSISNQPLLQEQKSVKRTFTLQSDSERRSGQELFAILGNSVSSGALAASSIGAFLMYGTNQSNELKVALTVLAMFAGGLMSMGSALSRVNAEETKPVNNTRNTL
ncbi:MAG: hypothetical protein ACHQAX_01490 [Gammaproteobacteria bacterium]